MKAALFRTGSGSIPVQSPVLPARESISKAYKPMISMNLDWSIRRTSSESDVMRSAFEGSGVNRTLSKLGSTSLPAIIPEEDCEVLDKLEILRSIGSLSLTGDRQSYAGDWPVNGIPIDELGFPGGGMGKNRKFGGGSGGNSDPKEIGEYYKEMLNSDPMNSLLLRNYGKYLHEVERDFVKAEEYYGRAILASPGDGEVLSLYGKLVWETQRDERRAKSYFDQAVHVSSDDW
ncbi:unnamed protein product [Withania somnifera]